MRYHYAVSPSRGNGLKTSMSDLYLQASFVNVASSRTIELLLRSIKNDMRTTTTTADRPAERCTHSRVAASR